MNSDQWQEQYEAWLDERANHWITEDNLPDNECPMCGAEIDTDVRYCRDCGDFV
jgi:hypothetical protein